MKTNFRNQTFGRIPSVSTFSFFLGTMKTFSGEILLLFFYNISWFISFCQLTIFVVVKICSQIWCSLQACLLIISHLFIQNAYYIVIVFFQLLFFIHQPGQIGRIISSLHFVLASGDFGNENVDLVRSIADLEITKAVILGNHDAWNTQKFSGK